MKPHAFGSLISVIRNETAECWPSEFWLRWGIHGKENFHRTGI